MPTAVHHGSIRNIPASTGPAFAPDGLVLMPGVPTPVTPEQARHLALLGVDIQPDAPASEPAPADELPPTPSAEDLGGDHHED